jgi:hypothetical protein
VITTTIYSPELLAQLAALCEADPDREVCGFIVRRDGAAIDGQPAVPGADYLVLGVRGGRVTEVKCFRWDGRGFVEAGHTLLTR